jgi:predicted small lipoprotein YifL
VCKAFADPLAFEQEEERMTRRGFSLTMGILLLFTVAACERQGPPLKPIGAATNKHVEEAPAPPTRSDADAMIQRMKTPMEDARHTEDALKRAAERTRQQAEQITP